MKVLTPHADLTGKQADVSNACQFGWFESMRYRDYKKNFPEHEKIIRKSLGPKKGMHNVIFQWVLQPTGQVTARSTVIISKRNSKVEEETLVPIRDVKELVYHLVRNKILNLMRTMRSHLRLNLM